MSLRCMKKLNWDVSYGRAEFSLVHNFPDWFWKPHRLLFSGYRDSVPEIKRRGSQVTAQLNLMLSLRMGGSTFLLPLYPFAFWAGTSLHLFCIILYVLLQSMIITLWQRGWKGRSVWKQATVIASVYSFHDPSQLLNWKSSIWLPTISNITN
jgi:hypothetical protein